MEEKTALTEIGEEEDRLNKNRRGGETDFTETEDRGGDWLVGEK